MCFFILASFLNASNLTRIYLNEGLKAVEKELEKELMSKDFWLEELKDQNLSLGYYDSPSAIIVANKTEKSFKVFFYDKGKISEEFTQQNVLTGLMGDKKVEGDLKTPVGFYELGKQFDPPTTYYGYHAFATTYPNLLDKVQGKTGGGIWIHGYPLDGSRLDEYKTRGCIALYNENLQDFAKLISTQTKVFTMIEEEQITRTNADEIASLLASLFQWKKNWSDSELKEYLSFYDEEEFRRFDKMKFKQFAKMKEGIFARKQEKEIKFSKIDISPYPNINKEKLFRISFYEDYKTQDYKFAGTKTLYVKLDENGKMKIIAEQ